MEFSTSDRPGTDELVDLYRSVNWTVYSNDPHGLSAAVAGSSYVITARDDDGLLVGLARALSDDVSIFYLQDLLIRPSHQRQGLGRHLLDRCLTRFSHVRQRVLLTDDEEHQHRLYRAAGYRDVATVTSVPIHAFVSIKGVELS